MDSGSRLYLSFRLSNKEFAIDAACVRGIIPVQELTPVPASRAEDAGNVAGFVTVSGHTFPVLDLRPRLGLASLATGGPQARIVVVQTDEGILRGFIADRVSDILTYRSRNVRDGKLYGNGRTRRVLDLERTRS